MNFNIHKNLSEYYQRFDNDHQQLRLRLLERLPSQPVIAPGVRFRLGLRSIAAAAAMIAVLVGALWLFSPRGENAYNTQAAWAMAVERAAGVNDVHFKLTTYQPHGRSSTVEMWWRRPDCFRAVFDQNIIITGNAQMRCNYNQSTNILTISPASTPGPELFLLGELGRLFIDQGPFARQWIQDSKIIHSEEIKYKGEFCQKVVTEKDGKLFEYIMDKNTLHEKGASADMKSPFYEVKIYDNTSRDKVLSHMEILDIDKAADDSLFTIDGEGKLVKDNRGKTVK